MSANQTPSLPVIASGLCKDHNCYTCKHRRDLSGSCHSYCNNMAANAEGQPHGIKNGWFSWPWNFDPVWLVSCDGWEGVE